jgi:hypothetical protein
VGDQARDNQAEEEEEEDKETKENKLRRKLPWRVYSIQGRRR